MPQGGVEAAGFQMPQAPITHTMPLVNRQAHDRNETESLTTLNVGVMCMSVVQQMTVSVSSPVLVAGFTRHVLSCHMDHPQTTLTALVR